MWPLASGAASLVRAGMAAADPVTLFFEVAAASGVPDMLVVEFDGAAVAERRRSELAPVVGTTSARAVWALRERSLDAGHLSEEVGMSSTHLRRSVLPPLVDSGAIVATDDGWTAAAAMRPLLSSVIAVEAKLRDWRGAYKQARRYTRFANSTYIAMDARSSSMAVRYSSEMLAAGIGVATVDAADGWVQVHTRPRRQASQVPWEQFLIGERVWELVLQGARSGPSFDVFGRTPDPTPDADSAPAPPPLVAM